MTALLAVTSSFLADSPATADSGVRFHDFAAKADSGIAYHRVPSPRRATLSAILASGRLRLAEDLPRLPGKPYGAPGVALFDFDGDGDLDVYVTNGPGAPNSLYSSQLTESGELRFVDVATEVGADATAQDSTGVCVGDIDNDGDSDLMVLGALGPNRLLENRRQNGAPRFVDITTEAGIAGGTATSASCSMGDVDGDGRLDIAVANTYDWSNSLGLLVPFAHNQPNQLFLNTGGNVFRDISESSGFRQLGGLAAENAGAAGVTWAITMLDVDLDGDTDIMSFDNRGSRPGPDGAQHGLIHLHRNLGLDPQGQVRFVDVTEEVGLDISSAWLGVSFGDFNCDHHLDFFTTNAGDYPPSFHPPGLELEIGDFSSRWFLGRPDGTFTDPGLGELRASVSGWGTSTLDYDNDGDTDIVFHGGLYSGFFLDAGNPGVLLQNQDCSARFVYDQAALAASPKHQRRNVQGTAVGDLDRDGFQDIVSVSSFDIPESVALTRNPAVLESPFDDSAYMVVTHEPGERPGELIGHDFGPTAGTLTVDLAHGNGNRNGWVEVSLLGGSGSLPDGRVNRDGVGATVFLSTSRRAQAGMKPIVAGSSYASQDARTAHFGLGSEPTGAIEVLWPGGIRNRLQDVTSGERIVFPEIPCDHASRLENPSDYRGCVERALDGWLTNGVLDSGMHQRFLASALGAGAASPDAAPSPDAAATPTAAVTEWHQFRGPTRSGTSPETGLARQWPEEGPPVLWRRPLGEGFAGLSISGQRLFTSFAIEDEEFLGSFDIADGKELWRVALGSKFQENFGNGPRATPTIGGSTVYALGAKGRLLAVDAETGEIDWQVELQERYPIDQPQSLLALAPTPSGPQLPVFGYAGSPLVIGDLLIVETGAGQGKSFVGLDKHTGSERWAALDSEAGYASPIDVEIGGRRQIIVLAGTEIVALSHQGQVIWRHPWAPTTAQPVFIPPDRIFVSTVSGVGAMVFSVDAGDDGSPATTEHWRLPRFRNAWNSSILVDGHVYGFDNATFRSVDATSGEIAWSARGLGQGSLLAADGLLIALSDRGKLVLLTASSEAYQEQGRFQLLEGRTWTPPTLSGGVLYVRNHDELVAVDLENKN